jgi:hypothetical protein
MVLPFKFSINDSNNGHDTRSRLNSAVKRWYSASKILTNVDDTQPMDMTVAFGTIRTPQRMPPSLESSPFYNSPVARPLQPSVDAEIIRSPLSSGITGTPKRTPSRGLVALDLLTGKPLTPLQAPSRRKSDSGIILGSPRAANRLRTRKSIAGVEEFAASAGVRRVSIGRDAWRSKEFGGDIQRTMEETGIRDMISRLSPKKPVATPVKVAPKSLATENDEIMLTPGMMKKEFRPKVANLVKVWEDSAQNAEEEEEFPAITLAEFLSMTNISFLDGLGPSNRRRTYIPPEGLSTLQKPSLQDYAKAGAVSIPMLELYQFVLPS